MERREFRNQEARKEKKTEKSETEKTKKKLKIQDENLTNEKRQLKDWS